MWKLEDWQYPCYNIKNGRCNAILKWNKSYKLIYEEQTKNIIPILLKKKKRLKKTYSEKSPNTIFLRKMTKSFTQLSLLKKNGQFLKYCMIKISEAIEML